MLSRRMKASSLGVYMRVRWMAVMSVGGLLLTAPANDWAWAHAWTGTYSLQFTGAQCDCFGFGTPCINQTFPVTATR